MSDIRVLVVDDQPLVRAGFRMVVDARPGLTTAGEAADGQEAVRLAAELQPDVILMDVRMPVMDGVEATRRIISQRHAGGCRVLMLTTFDLDEYVYAALHAGASGFLLKDVVADDLVHAIEVVARGDALLAPALTRRLIERYLAQPGPAGSEDTTLAELTAREKDVLRLLAQGLSNQEIADRMHVSPTTVKTHVAHLLMKLELQDRTQAVVFAYESGFVTPGGGA